MIVRVLARIVTDDLQQHLPHMTSQGNLRIGYRSMFKSMNLWKTNEESRKSWLKEIP
jgi:hypothetical protein